MALATHRFAPNSAHVAATVVDEVAILINLSTGAYYSMEQTAATIWTLIQQQCSVPEIVAALTAAYDVAEADAAADVERLLGELLREDLVVGVAEDPSPDAPSAPGGASAATPERRPYQPPRLEVFGDLSPLLANDPPELIPPILMGDESPA